MKRLVFDAFSSVGSTGFCTPVSKGSQEDTDYLARSFICMKRLFLTTTDEFRQTGAIYLKQDRTREYQFIS
jgi:hypothetical protein